MAKASDTTDLVRIESADDMVAAIRGELVPEIEDPEQVALAIMERVLAMGSADAVLGGNQAIHAQDVLDRPFTLHGLHMMRSRFEGGAGVFVVLDAEFGDDGSHGAITCSGRTVMAQAVQLFRLDALPQTVKVVRAARETANGHFPLWLEAA